ncbi:MAG: NUDIX hydrolase [Actinomycetota bacterium]
MSVPVRNAATVMLVRDGDDGLEVFMLRRNPNSTFVGGVWVFPGGAVDPADADDPLLDERCVGRDDAEASRLIGVDRGGLAFWVAAIRESFEEAGVLLASTDDGEFVSFADPDDEERFARHRAQVDAGERRLAEVCRDEDLRLAVGELHYFSHWITPVGPPRRFDTRFFVCRAPAEQEPLHDDGETVDSLWTRPADALAAHRAGDIDLILPTIKNLAAIEPFATADELLAAAATIAEVPTMLPVVVEAPDSDVEIGGRGVRILLPGDDGYDAALTSAQS